MKKFQFMGTLCLVALIAATPACNTTKEAQQTTTTEKTATHNKRPAGKQILADSLLNGEWLFTQAAGQVVVGDKVPQITFDLATSRVFGNNGCNVFNGSLILGEGNEMSFGNCVTTMMACRPEITDRNIMEALNTTTHYNVVKHTNDELKVDLLDSNGAVVATITRQLRELLNGHWDVVEVNGKAVTLDEKPSMVLDITLKTITGNSGCNRMSGSLEYDASEVNNGLRFARVASTRRMCTMDVMEVENALLNAINEVDAFRIIDETHVALYRIPEKTNLIVLQRK